MNKHELTQNLAAERAITPQMACDLLDDLASIVAGELLAGNQITLPGIGTFRAELQPGLVARSTGEPMALPGRIVVRFVPSSDLKYLLAI